MKNNSEVSYHFLSLTSVFNFSLLFINFKVMVVTNMTVVSLKPSALLLTFTIIYSALTHHNKMVWLNKNAITLWRLPAPLFSPVLKLGITLLLIRVLDPMNPLFDPEVVIFDLHATHFTI